MRATLLESNPDIALVLPCVFAALGIPLTAVGTVDAVRRATQRAAFDDVIIVDCSLDRPEDRAHCGEIVRQAGLEVHVIYAPAAPDHATFRREVERAVRGDIKWLPATVGLVEFVTILRGLRDQALQARALSVSRQRPLTHHQHRVWALVAAGRSQAEIAQEMGSSKGAVKQDIARIKEKTASPRPSSSRSPTVGVAYRWTANR